MSEFIGNLVEANSMLIGGTKIAHLVDDNRIKILSGVISPGAAPRRSTFKDEFGVAYQVPVNKRLLILAVLVNPGSVGSEGGFNLMYSDNNVGTNTATAPTNPIYFGNYSSTFTDLFYLNSSTAATNQQGQKMSSLAFSCPANTYPGVDVQTTGSGNVSFTVLALELDV